MVVSGFSNPSMSFFRFVTGLTAMQRSGGALMYSEIVEVLRKFMDRYGGFMDIMSITSSFSRSAAFRDLGLVLHEIDTMQLLDITD